MKLMNNKDGYIRFNTLQDTLNDIGEFGSESVYSVKMDNEGNVEDVTNIFEDKILW